MDIVNELIVPIQLLIKPYLSEGISEYQEIFRSNYSYFDRCETFHSGNSSTSMTKVSKNRVRDNHNIKSYVSRSPIASSLPVVML